jgi:Zn ribbon nucleic-acid-binding protein
MQLWQEQDIPTPDTYAGGIGVWRQTEDRLQEFVNCGWVGN